MIMKKKILLFLSISAAAVMLASCGESYEDKAKEWLRLNVEHFVNINDEHQVLYYPDDLTLIKVDLATGESAKCMNFKGDETYAFDKVQCIFPKDKGYEEDKDHPASTKFVVIGCNLIPDRYIDGEYYDGVEVALLFDTEKEKAKTICKGSLENHGEFIVNTIYEREYIDGYWAYGDVLGYDFYNVADGEKVDGTVFTGNAGRNNIHMELCFGTDGLVVGKYYYTKYGLKKPLGLKGEIDQDGNLVLKTAWVGYGNTEVWKGKLKGNVFEGQYSLEKNLGKDVYRDFTLIQQ